MAVQSHAQSLSTTKPEAKPPLEHVSQGVLVSQLAPEVLSEEADEGGGLEQGDFQGGAPWTCPAPIRAEPRASSRFPRLLPHTARSLARLARIARLARSAADSPAHVHEQVSATVEPSGVTPVAAPPFWHTLPSAPVVQQGAPQMGSVPALPKASGSEEMSATHQGEMSWENAAASMNM